MRRRKSDLHARVNRNLPLEFDDVRLTSYAGLELLERYLRTRRFNQLVREAFADLPRWGDFGVVVMVRVFVGLVIVGGRRLRHLAYVADDPIFQRFGNVRVVPTARTLSRWLRHFTMRTVTRQAVQDAGDRQSPEGPRRDNRHGLMGGVVDNGQARHDPPIRRAIEDEVRGPDLVATLGAHQWLAVGDRDLLASTALQLEPGLRVQAIDSFVIDDVAGLPQLQIDHPGPIASMSLRQVNDPIPDDRIAIGPWHVPEG